MLEYECDKCNMSVTGLTCGQCGMALEHKTIEKEGKKINVSKCPEGCGQIKSPQCCGHDMHVHHTE